MSKSILTVEPRVPISAIVGFYILSLSLGCQSPSGQPEFARERFAERTELTPSEPTSISDQPVVDTKTAIEVTPSTLVNGALMVVRVRPQLLLRSENLEGKAVFEGKDAELFPAGDGTYLALFGTDYDAKPGKATLTIQARALKTSNSAPTTSSTGTKTTTDLSTFVTFTQEVMIADGQYPVGKLSVNPKYVKLSKKDRARANRDKALVGAVYRENLREKLWTGPFRYPIDSPTTGAFGKKRTYNGELKSVHYGLDLKAAVGTPVYAPAKGRVALAKDLFYTGNTVILSHGYGMFTLYAHMSKLRVKAGDIVDTGATLGLSGATGRVEGPHLHWGLIVHGMKVDPLGLIKTLR